MGHFTEILLPTFSDTRGDLTVLEDVLPFPIVRTYWIYGADGSTRGGHRHREARHALVAVSGTVTIFMDDSVTSENVVLDSPRRCLLVEPKDWHTMTFGPNAVLLVLSSRRYDRSDYIDTPYESSPT